MVFKKSSTLEIFSW